MGNDAMNNFSHTDASDEALMLDLELLCHDQLWRFHWELGQEARLIEAVRTHAGDNSVSLDWMDAAVICKHVTRQSRRALEELSRPTDADT
jgi:hypothetical protein